MLSLGSSEGTEQGSISECFEASFFRMLGLTVELKQSGNTDLQVTVRLFKQLEEKGKWLKNCNELEGKLRCFTVL